MQNIKMLLFFHVKTPCFEVFLSYEFYSACFSVLSSSTHSVAVSSILSVRLRACIYTHTHTHTSRIVHSQQLGFIQSFQHAQTAEINWKQKYRFIHLCWNGDECKQSGKSVELPWHHNLKFQVPFLLPDPDQIMFPSYRGLGQHSTILELSWIQLVF